MPRLDPVPRSDANPPIVTAMYEFMFGDRDPVSQPGTSTGTSGDWWTVFANAPDVMEHAVGGFALYQSPDRELDPVLRELGQARVGWAAQSRFVFSQHCKSLRGLGVAEDKIEAVPRWSTADCFGEAERVVLAYVDCLVLEHGRVPDELFADLRAHLSDVAVIELTYICTLYLHHAVMSRALRTELDDVDEPVAEVFVEGADDELRTQALED